MARSGFPQTGKKAATYWAKVSVMMAKEDVLTTSTEIQVKRKAITLPIAARTYAYSPPDFWIRVPSSA